MKDEKIRSQVSNHRCARCVGRRSMKELLSAFRLHPSAFDKRGQGAMEIVLIIPFMILVFAVLVVFGRLVYIQVALDSAARDGARMAVETLSDGRGPEQGYRAASWALSGFNLRPEQATYTLNTHQAWGRGTEVEMRVSYRPSMQDVMGVGWIFDYTNRTMTGRAVMRVEEWKSRWQ
jgi:Flp pilus assembly protein TadG